MWHPCPMPRLVASAVSTLSVVGAVAYGLLAPLAFTFGLGGLAVFPLRFGAAAAGTIMGRIVRQARWRVAVEPLHTGP